MCGNGQWLRNTIRAITHSGDTITINSCVTVDTYSNWQMAMLDVQQSTDVHTNGRQGGCGVPDTYYSSTWYYYSKLMYQKNNTAVGATEEAADSKRR